MSKVLTVFNGTRRKLEKVARGRGREGEADVSGALSSVCQRLNRRRVQMNGWSAKGRTSNWNTDMWSIRHLSFLRYLHEYCSVQETLVMILFVELAAVLDFNVTLQIYLTGKEKSKCGTDYDDEDVVD